MLSLVGSVTGGTSSKPFDSPLVLMARGVYPLFAYPPSLELHLNPLWIISHSHYLATILNYSRFSMSNPRFQSPILSFSTVENCSIRFPFYRNLSANVEPEYFQCLIIQVWHGLHLAVPPGCDGGTVTIANADATQPACSTELTMFRICNRGGVAISRRPGSKLDFGAI